MGQKLTTDTVLGCIGYDGTTRSGSMTVHMLEMATNQNEAAIAPHWPTPGQRLKMSSRI